MPTKPIMHSSFKTVHFFYACHIIIQVSVLITASNITMQFGEKPLFENVSVKFGNGNRYGLIGPNGCGKSEKGVSTGQSQCQ